MPRSRVLLLAALAVVAAVQGSSATADARIVAEVGADAAPARPAAQDGPAVLAVRLDLAGAQPAASEVPAGPVAIGEALQVLRGTVLAVEDGLLRVQVGRRELLVRPPRLDGAEPLAVAVGDEIEVAGSPTLGAVFEADALAVLGPGSS